MYQGDGYHALSLHIHETVDRRFSYLIQGKSVHSMMAALQNHIRPSALERELTIERAWDDLKKG